MDFYGIICGNGKGVDTCAHESLVCSHWELWPKQKHVGFSSCRLNEPGLHDTHFLQSTFSCKYIDMTSNKITKWISNRGLQCFFVPGCAWTCLDLAWCDQGMLMESFGNNFSQKMWELHIIHRKKHVPGAHGCTWIQALISLVSLKYDSLTLYCSLNYIQWGLYLAKKFEIWFNINTKSPFMGVDGPGCAWN